MECAKLQDDDSLLKSFIELEENCPKMLRPRLEDVLSLALEVSPQKCFLCQSETREDPLAHSHPSLPCL